MTPDQLNVYDVLLVSLHKSYRRHTGNEKDTKELL